MFILNIFLSFFVFENSNDSYFEITDLIYQVDRVLKHHFPGLTSWFEEVKDPRKFGHYSLSNLLMQGLFLFISQESSRNSFNNRAQESELYRENFSHLFKGMKVAHFDTVDLLLREIKTEDLERVKEKMICRLIEKKVLQKYQGCYLVSIDATGVTSYDENKELMLLHRKYKNDQHSYLNIMLEAKLVTPEGLCLSLASEALSNEDRSEYEKQDCELTAFKRLSKKLKSRYPRLPVCILADALYANKRLFSICQSNGWKFIATFKDGQLKSVQTEITDTAESARIRFEKNKCFNKQQGSFSRQSYQAMEGLQYLDYKLNWVECIETLPDSLQKPSPAKPCKFIYLTNISLGEMAELKEDTIIKIVKAGRCRWKTENEGFNTQKNLGYHLHHKFARNSVKTLHRYYQLLQIAHMINQLVTHTQTVVRWLNQKSRRTEKALWDTLRSVLCFGHLDEAQLIANEGHYQIRYE